MRGCAFVLAAALGGCATPPAAPPRAVMKCPTVPRLRYDDEVAPARPAGSAPMTLAPGHWEWNGSSYDWVRPGWVARSGGRIWQDGFWTASGIACFWTAGRLVF